jgi:adenylate kinase family enzyme
MKQLKIILITTFLVEFLAITPIQALVNCPSISPGDNIKIVGKSPIYYVDATLTYRYYPSMEVYRSWNSVSSRPYKVIPEKCIKCSGELGVRADDKEEVIRHRIELQGNKANQSIREFYKDLGRLETIDGMKTIEEVSKEVDDIIKNS